jgi:hypothetical protein
MMTLEKELGYKHRPHRSGFPLKGKMGQVLLGMTVERAVGPQAPTEKKSLCAYADPSPAAQLPCVPSSQ